MYCLQRKSTTRPTDTPFSSLLLPLLQAVADWKPVASPPSPRQTENEKNIDDGLNAFIELIHQTKENKDS